MNEQAAGLEGAGLAGGGVPRLPVPFVLLTGGKGGVGKTTACANLGVHLARAGRRVLLVDLDLGLANLAVMMRLFHRYTIEDHLAGRRALCDCVVRGPAGVDVLPAGSGTADMGRPDRARRGRIARALAELASGYDVVLGDSPAGIGPDVLAWAAAADLVLVVTTPEPAALTDAYGLTKALDAWSSANGVDLPTPELVLNLVGGSDEAEKISAKLRSVCERFLSRAPRMAGWLPRSMEVRASVAAQQPFVLSDPKCLASKCLGRLAERVSRLTQAAPRPLAS